MSLIESCKNGDLEGVKTALQSGDDVNTKDEDGWTGLMWAVSLNHNSVVDLLLEKPNIDVNLKSESSGFCALHCAVFSQNSDGLKMLLNVPNINVNIMNIEGWSALDMTFLPFLPGKHFAGKCRNKHNEALKLLLNVPTIDVNTVDNRGENALHWALDTDSFEGLKLLLHHPNLTALTLNQKDKWFGNTPAMQAVKQNTLKYLEVLVADPRVDLDTTDKEGRTLKKAARWLFLDSQHPATGIHILTIIIILQLCNKTSTIACVFCIVCLLHFCSFEFLSV